MCGPVPSRPLDPTQNPPSKATMLADLIHSSSGIRAGEKVKRGGEQGEQSAAKDMEAIEIDSESAGQTSNTSRV